jgi:hypothetical protein
MEITSITIVGKKISLDTKNILPNLMKITTILGSLAFLMSKIPTSDAKDIKQMLDCMNSAYYCNNEKVPSGFSLSLCRVAKKFCDAEFPNTLFFSK